MKRKSTKTPSRRTRFVLAGGLGVTLLAAGAFAQQDSRPLAAGADQAGQANRPDVAPERVIITGTYIPTAEGEGPLPVATFSSDDLRKLTGGTAPIEAIRQLPSFVGSAASENSSNGQEGGGDGTGQINLRGLGPQNTLILINGRRASRTAGLGLADINAIPIGAIERVEILKDGASATYGSDAVAGVANFILKQEFSGAEVNFLYGNTTNNDADVKQAYAITGFKTEKFDVLFNANYYNREELAKKDRYLSSLLDRRSLGGNISGGSSNYPGRIDSNTLGGLVLNDGQQSTVVPTNPGDYRKYFSGVNPATNTTDQFNIGPFTPVSPKDERFSYYGAFDVHIIPQAVTLYGNAIISQQRFYNSLAASPLVITEASISPYDPLASPANDGTSDLNNARYRTFELGNRQNFYEKKFYHFIAGLKGDVALKTNFLGSLNYDVGVVHDEEKEINANAGGVTASLLDIELASGAFNPFIGLNAPRAGTALITNGPNKGQLGNYDNVAALQRSTYSAESVFFDKENVVEGHINGLFFPEAPQGGLSLALGGEYREDFTSVEPAPILLAGDNFGEFNALQGFHVQQYVSSVFGEIRVPIVAPSMKVPGIYALEFTVAGRYQKFSLGGTNPVTLRQSSPTFETSNPKYALRFQPIPDITLRASYSTSFRAPGLADLFQTAATDFATISDPVTGLTQQVQQGDVQSGNPGLSPEETDSYTAGIVLSPRFVPGFTVTVDYYQLNQKNVIISGSDSAQFRVNQNFFGGGPGNPGAPFAGDIVRGADNTILSVLETPLNAARVGIEGIDISAFYEIDFKEYGKVNLNAGLNHLFRYNAAVSPTSGFENFTGNFSTDPLTPGSLPVNKGLFTIEYQWKGFDLVNTVNYIGDYVDNGAFVNNSQLKVNALGNPEDPANPSYTRNRKVREYTTWDVQLSYTFAPPDAPAAPTPMGKDYKGSAKEAPVPGVAPKWYQRLLGGTRLTVGCNDVLDTPPPFAAGSTESNYDESLYNIRNRFYYVSIDKKF